MIYGINSSLSTFKPVRFQSGLNLVVAEKSKDATSRQTRNGSGKSSLVRIIDFLLGSDCDTDSLFRYESMINEQFTLQLDLGGKQVSATRTGEEKAKIVVDGDFDGWPVGPKLHKSSGEYRISNTDWKAVLGKKMFGFTSVDTPD